MSKRTSKKNGIILLLISGKRKSGKDFIAEKIRERYNIVQGHSDSGAYTKWFTSLSFCKRIILKTHFKLLFRLGNDISIILRISAPLKAEYAKVNGQSLLIMVNLIIGD